MRFLSNKEINLFLSIKNVYSVFFARLWDIWVKVCPNYGHFAATSFHCWSLRYIIKSIRCNQLFVLNGLKQLRMNYKVITS